MGKRGESKVYAINYLQYNHRVPRQLSSCAWRMRTEMVLLITDKWTDTWKIYSIRKNGGRYYRSISFSHTMITTIDRHALQFTHSIRCEMVSTKKNIFYFNNSLKLYRLLFMKSFFLTYLFHQRKELKQISFSWTKVLFASETTESIALFLFKFIRNGHTMIITCQRVRDNKFSNWTL